MGRKGPKMGRSSCLLQQTAESGRQNTLSACLSHASDRSTSGPANGMFECIRKSDQHRSAVLFCTLKIKDISGRNNVAHAMNYGRPNCRKARTRRK